MSAGRKAAVVVIPVVIFLCFALFLWSQGQPNTMIAGDIVNYKVIEAKDDPRELGEVYIQLYSQADFEEAIRLLQGSDAVVFHDGSYNFFPYQGYFIVYKGTLE